MRSAADGLRTISAMTLTWRHSAVTRVTVSIPIVQARDTYTNVSVFTERHFQTHDQNHQQEAFVFFLPR